MNKKNYLAIFAKSFNWAGFFLPKKIYEDTAKLYAFCRVLDDIADKEIDLDSKTRRIDEMRNFLKKYYDADNTEVHSSNENEKIVHDVVTLAKNNNIKNIIIFLSHSFIIFLSHSFIIFLSHSFINNNKIKMISILFINIK